MIRRLLSKIVGDNLSKSERKYAKINFVIILLMFIVSAIMLFLLPKEIPILHDGDVQYPVPTILGVWIMPLVGIVINYIFIKQERLNLINSIFLGIFFLGSTYFYITLL